jgi:hypothetical protein
MKSMSTQSSGSTHIHQTSQKKFKEMLSPCQKAEGNCFLRQERSADGGIHATRNHNNVRSVLQNTKKNCVGSFRKKGVEC